MPVITMDQRDFLQPKLVEGIVNREINPQLSFLNVFPVIPTTATSVSYMVDDDSAADDIASGKTGTPIDMGEMSKLSSIDVSPVNRKNGALTQFGYEIRVSKRDFERSEIIDDLNRAVSRAAYGMAKKINGDIVGTLKAVVNDISEVDGAATWDLDTATPVEDILSFADAMDLETTDYELTDLYLNKTNYFELLKYLQGIDINWVLDPMKNSQRAVPAVNGVNIHKLYSSELAEGAYLGIDGRPGNTPLTTYAYSPQGYQEEGEYPLVYVNQYTEDGKGGSIVTEFLAETFHAVKIPNAVTYKSGAI